MSRRVLSAGDSDRLLTRRQLTVLGLMAKGLSNKEIAAVLGLRRQTVKNHCREIFRRLGLDGGEPKRLKAVLQSARTGLITLGE